MADTDTASAAADPAEVPQQESSANPKTENSSKEQPTEEEEGERKWEVNGKSNDRYGHHRNGHGYGRANSNYNSNKKRNNEFANLPESDDPAEIRNQVEFYFSTQNLATDEHLFMELHGPKNRPVSIKHVHTFKRMRRFTPYSAIVAALRESNDLIVVDDGDYSGTGNEAIKRKDPLLVDAKPSDEEEPPTTIQLFYRLKAASSNNLERSIYAKGFGNEDDAGQIALEQFFRPYGSVMVRKRRDDNNAWKGSVFVEFDTEDSQKQYLALDPKPKFKDNQLTTMAKKDYVIMKCKEKGIKPEWELTEKEKYEQRRKRREEEADSRPRDSDRRGGGRGRGRGGRGGRAGFDRRDNGRDNGRDRRDRDRNRNRSRSRSPRARRDHSDSEGSVESRDWNKRRDRYQKGRNDRAGRKQDKKGIDRDAYGVPIVKDTRTEAEIAASNKRKADDQDRADSAKKGKLEIKQDE